MEEEIDTIVDIVDKHMDGNGVALTTQELDDIRYILERAAESQ